MPKNPETTEIRDILENRFFHQLIDQDIPREDAEAIAYKSVSTVLQACFHLVKEKKYKCAVLGRWRVLVNAAISTSWPIEDDLQIVAEWCQDQLSQRPPDEWVEEFVSKANLTWVVGDPPIVKDGRIKLSVAACVVVYEAYFQVLEGRELEAIRIGTDKVCFSFYMALNHGADPNSFWIAWNERTSKYEIFDKTRNGYPIRLPATVFVRTAAYLVGKDGKSHFEALDTSTPSEFMEQDTDESKDVKALQKRFFGPFAIRLWAALLANGQDGEFDFDPEYTLALMHYSKRYRREPKVQYEIRLLVNLFRHFNIRLGAKDDYFDPVPIKTKEDKYSDPFFELSRLSTIRPELISGASKGEYFLLPADLCNINHKPLPHVYPLSFFLAVMFQRAFQYGKQWVEVSGKKLLILAREKKYTKKIRKALQTSMDMLVKAQVIDHYEWRNFPWSPGGTIRFEAPRWVVERLLYGIAPIEPVYVYAPDTGEALRNFRKQMSLTQDQLAQLVGVNRITIIRYEKAESIPERFIDKLEAWQLDIAK